MPRPYMTARGTSPYLDYLREENKRLGEESRQRALEVQLGQTGMFDPGELAKYRQLGGTLEPLIPRPQPRKSQAEQELDQAKREYDLQRYREAMKPKEPAWNEYVDPITGQRFSRRTVRPGMEETLPIMGMEGVPLYQPKEKAWVGPTPEGGEWAMARGKYGEATGYQTIKEPPKPQLIRLPSGEQFMARPEQTPEGGITWQPVEEQIKGKGPLVRGELKPQKVSTRWFTGEKRGEELMSGTVQASDAAKKTWHGMENNLSKVESEVKKLGEESQKARGMADVEGADRLLDEQKLAMKKRDDLLQQMEKFKGAVRREAGPHAQRVLEQIVGITEFGEEGGGNLRPDGTPKGTGFFGPLKMTDGSGRTMTEFSVGIPINGQEMDVPTLVPTLTKEELDSLLSGEKPSRTIIQKAADFARRRISQGKSVYSQPGEEIPLPGSQSPKTIPEQASYVVRNKTTGKSYRIRPDQIQAVMESPEAELVR